LWSLRVASSSALIGAHRPRLDACSASVDARARELQQRVEVRARERRALGGRLDLHEPASPVMTTLASTSALESSA
jgi:hypothetical protein